MLIAHTAIFYFMCFSLCFGLTCSSPLQTFTMLNNGDKNSKPFFVGTEKYKGLLTGKDIKLFRTAGANKCH